MIQRCFAKASDDRWQTARDVMKELEWIAAGRSHLGSTASVPSGRASRWSSWAWTAASFVVGLSVASLAAVFYMRVPDDVSITRFSFIAPELGGTAFLSVSPDGRRIAFVAKSSPSVFSLYVRSMDAVEGQVLPGTEGAQFPFWSPDSRYIGFGTSTQLKRIDVLSGPPQAICDVQNFAGGTWNADGVIVFGSFPGPLKRVSASGGEPTAFTALGPSELGHAFPAFLPDGRHLLFLSGGAPPQTGIILVTSLDSQETSQVLKGSGNFAYAPPGYLLFHRNGTLMAQPFDVSRYAVSGEPARIADGLAVNGGLLADFSASHGVLVYRMNLTGSPSQLVWHDRTGKSLGPVGAPGDYHGIALSPDEKRIAVHQHQEPNGGDIWVLDQDRGAFSKLTLSTAHNITPMWSRDGNAIAFASDRGGGIFNIFQRASSGAGTDELVVKYQDSTFPEDWSADGKLMLYGRLSGPRVDIMVLPMTGERKPRAFTTADSIEALSKFSPDGRWIAYFSTDSGRSEVYVQSYPDRSSKVQVSTHGGNYPRWARNGKELFYMTDDGTVMAVDVRPQGETLHAGAPRVLFKTPAVLAGHYGTNYAYDVTADGQRFIVNEYVTQTNQETPITVVVNWTAGLKK